MIRFFRPKFLSLIYKNYQIMGAAQLREELHQLIERADERLLNLIYGMMKADFEEGDYTLSNAHKKLLDERLTAHEKSPHEGAEWIEVKSRIKHKA